MTPTLSTALSENAPLCSAESAIDAYVAWVAGTVLPFWAHKRSNLRLLFVEQVNHRGHSDWPGYLRLRVISRQVAVYSQAAAAGLAWARPVAEDGWRVMQRYFWSTVSGWHARVGRHGQATDTQFALYDQVFALYACAHWIALSGDRQAVLIACRTLDLIERKLRWNRQPGWRTAFDRPEYDQNSHMHFLEALLALRAVVPEWRVGSRIEEILDLLAVHMVDPRSGTVLEQFDARWGVAGGSGTVEPGHQYEWAWLLSRARLAGFKPRVSSDPMVHFADKFGWCPQSDLLVNSCRPDGSVIDPGHRLWPHCEALRAATVIADDHSARARAEWIAGRIMARFAGHPFPAGWVERFDQSLRPSADAIPATSVYHLFEATLALVARGWAELPGARRCRSMVAAAGWKAGVSSRARRAHPRCSSIGTICWWPIPAFFIGWIRCT